MATNRSPSIRPSAPAPATAQPGNAGRRWEAHSLTERQTAEGLKTFWARIGVAFENRDGSWTVKLDALPVSGTLQIRPPSERTGGSEPAPF